MATVAAFSPRRRQAGARPARLADQLVITDQPGPAVSAAHVQAEDRCHGRWSTTLAPEFSPVIGAVAAISGANLLARFTAGGLGKAPSPSN